MPRHPPGAPLRALDAPGIGLNIPLAPHGVCLVAGARILTARGEVPVESLRSGDLVPTSGLGGPPRRAHPAGGGPRPASIRAAVDLLGHARADDAEHDVATMARRRM